MNELPRDEFLRKTLFKKYIEEDKNQCEHFIKELIPYHGTTEGAICNRNGCEGVLQIKAEYYTRCLQSEDVFLVCPECEWSGKDE